ncbi:MAG TPA: HAD family hydrolase [Opitutaceae bacterium]|nr:HAD family hydrolase [Opitutaceae bacterium]
MISVIGFDADDTLWHNESVFEANHDRFCALLSKYHDAKTVATTLYATEVRNLELYGYGVKGFALSAIECAIELTQGRISADELREIVVFAKEMLAHPVELIDGVHETLEALAADFRFFVITKGDLGHQERKLAASGLARFFERRDIVSEKDAITYRRILATSEVRPEEFAMVGNSMKSDILPALELGAHGIHVPYPLTWKGELAQGPAVGASRFHTLDSIRGLPDLVRRLNRG